MNSVEGAGGTNPAWARMRSALRWQPIIRVQVHGAEPFTEVVHGWACSAAPVHDPDTARLPGVIDLTGLMGTAHPDTIAASLAAWEPWRRTCGSTRSDAMRSFASRYLERLTSARDSVEM